LKTIRKRRVRLLLLDRIQYLQTWYFFQFGRWVLHRCRFIAYRIILIFQLFFYFQKLFVKLQSFFWTVLNYDLKHFLLIGQVLDLGVFFQDLRQALRQKDLWICNVS
jgi:hypothetical protein